MSNVSAAALIGLVVNPVVSPPPSAELAAVALLFAAILLYFPSRPPLPPSVAAASQRLSYRSSICRLLRYEPSRAHTNTHIKNMLTWHKHEVTCQNSISSGTFRGGAKVFRTLFMAVPPRPSFQVRRPPGDLRTSLHKPAESRPALCTTSFALSISQ